MRNAVIRSAAPDAAVGCVRIVPVDRGAGCATNSHACASCGAHRLRGGLARALGRSAEGVAEGLFGVPVIRSDADSGVLDTIDAATVDRGSHSGVGTAGAGRLRGAARARHGGPAGPQRPSCPGGGGGAPLDGCCRGHLLMEANNHACGSAGSAGRPGLVRNDLASLADMERQERRRRICRRRSAACGCEGYRRPSRVVGGLQRGGAGSVGTADGSEALLLSPRDRASGMLHDVQRIQADRSSQPTAGRGACGPGGSGGG